MINIKDPYLNKEFTHSSSTAAMKSPPMPHGRSPTSSTRITNPATRSSTATPRPASPASSSTLVVSVHGLAHPTPSRTVITDLHHRARSLTITLEALLTAFHHDLMTRIPVPTATDAGFYERYLNDTKLHRVLEDKTGYLVERVARNLMELKEVMEKYGAVKAYAESLREREGRYALWEDLGEMVTRWEAKCVGTWRAVVEEYEVGLSGLEECVWRVQRLLPDGMV